jgi:glutamine synthetase
MSAIGGYPASQAGLFDAIDRTPIIDNHAHPLLKLSYIEQFPLLAIATEANGDALESSRTGMAHIRAVNQLSRLLGCEPTWDAVAAAIKAKRQGDAHKAWVQRCMEGIEVVLVDDGLGDPDQAESYQYFDHFTPSNSKRIVRIEYEATLIIQRALEKGEGMGMAWQEVIGNFDNVIRKCIHDPEVVGFKSVICYRTGLDIGPRSGYRSRALSTFSSMYDASIRNGLKRLSHRGLNEYFVHRLAELIQEYSGSWKKPIQFHTGLGDNDITLTTSNPSYLQTFIREYPDVPIVLLHASYPFTREAGYLAAMYSHVYADIGEVFPFVNREGQMEIIKQILELCPISKILWSTDGHWFPETYLLAVEQMRTALKTVLDGFVKAGDLTYTQAIQLVEDILFNNSNKLYNLGLTLTKIDTRQASQQPREVALNALNTLSAKGAEVQFLRMTWVDMTSTTRLRVFPIRRIRTLLEENKPVSFNVITGAMGLLQNDFPIDDKVGVGERKLIPDWTSLRAGPREGHAVVRGCFQELDGSPVSTCPRTALKRVLDIGSKHGLHFTLGFEIELVLLQRTADGFGPVESDGHAWCVGRVMETDSALVIEEAIKQLDEAGVYVDIVHPESAHGQYEVVLPKNTALEAVDTLLYAREVIAACATKKGYKMTLHPKPSPVHGGTAAHVHMSISTPHGDKPHVYEPFYAGILKHLRAVMAFTCSSMASYDRIQDSIWTGGTWVAWGTQNRETPLRKISGSHWEVKCMDGTANPYLALAALIGAGLQGVIDQEELWLGDCSVKDSARLTDAERAELNITRRLPRELSEALQALAGSYALINVMGRELVEMYVQVKDAEMQFQETMKPEARLRWMIERY